VEKGSWIVKQAVGQNTPVLLGKKLTTKYFTGANYVEVRCASSCHLLLDPRAPHGLVYDADISLLDISLLYSIFNSKDFTDQLHTSIWIAPRQVDVDVGSSSSASSVVGLVAGAVKNLVIDMAVVLQVTPGQRRLLIRRWTAAASPSMPSQVTAAAVTVMQTS
jgi:Protein ENHANCED DISEASE RESISTANCE 2, C-terminal